MPWLSTAGPCLVCRPSQAAGCLSVCCLGRGWGEWLGQGPVVFARKGSTEGWSQSWRMSPGVEGSLHLLLLLANLGTICCLHMALCWQSSGLFSSPSVPRHYYPGSPSLAAGKEGVHSASWTPAPLCWELGVLVITLLLPPSPMISAKLLPLLKLATWSNTNVQF